jgi:ferredoxin--NADP+ reductase
LTRRAYSIASSPLVRDHAEFFVVLVDGGRLTTRLWTLGEQDRLWMDTRAKGTFTFDGVPPDQNLVMVSTGTGIAPFVSLMRTFGTERRWRRLVLLNGTRRSMDLGYADLLTRMDREIPEVTYIPMVSREPDGSSWTGIRGRVQQALEPEVFERSAGFELAPENTHVFLCGNPAMIDSVEQELHTRGFTTHSRRQPGNIHLERYW